MARSSGTAGTVIYRFELGDRARSGCRRRGPDRHPGLRAERRRCRSATCRGTRRSTGASTRPTADAERGTRACCRSDATGAGTATAADADHRRRSPPPCHRRRRARRRLPFRAVSGGRTPDPAPGQRLPLPSYGATSSSRSPRRGPICSATPVRSTAAAGASWMLVVDTLRTYDTRWGYNWKRGNVGDPSMDVDRLPLRRRAAMKGSTEVYIIDIIGGHCGSSPSPSWNDVTGATAAGGASAAGPAAGGSDCKRANGTSDEARRTTDLNAELHRATEPVGSQQLIS